MRKRLLLDQAAMFRFANDYTARFVRQIAAISRMRDRANIARGRSDPDGCLARRKHCPHCV